MDKQALKSLILSYDRAVPRYTSYPPANHFTAHVTGQTYSRWLQTAPQDLSLYIHIPFCSRLCYYCGCNMRVTNHYESVTAYLDVLRQEAAMVADRLPRGAQFLHVHFGGGSPSMIEADDFQKLVRDLRFILPMAHHADISLEADPRMMSADKAKAYAQSGVTRMSFGVQSFDDKVLSAINRPQPYALTANAVALCRKHGIRHINFDLMYGLPLQDETSMADTMHRAISLNPSRIAFFGYAHVPWMKKHMQLIEGSLPTAEQRYDLYTRGANTLTEAGYNTIGIDHFVRSDDDMFDAATNGTLRRNFQGYTTDKAQGLIGLGVSSIGMLPQGYVQNTADLGAYKTAIANNTWPTVKGYTTTKSDNIYAAVIESLMCFLWVDLSTIAKRFGVSLSLFDDARARLAPFIAQGFVTLHGSRIFIKPEGRMLVRLVCHAFDRHTPAHNTTSHAQAI